MKAVIKREDGGLWGCGRRCGHISHGTARCEISCNGELDMFGFPGLGRQARRCARVLFPNAYRAAVAPWAVYMYSLSSRVCGFF